MRSRLRLRLALTIAFGYALSQTGLAAAQGLPLGRLFHTPGERSQLNAKRSSGGQPVAVAQSAPEPAPPLPPEPVQLDGVLQRSNGTSTVWLNQEAQQGAKVLKDSAVSLQLPSGKRVTLKPGQTYDEADGTVRDVGR